MPRPIREVPWLEQRNGVYNVRWYEPPTEEAKQRNPQAKGETKRLGLRTRDAAEAATRYAEFLRTGYHKTVGSSGQLTVTGAIGQYKDEHVDLKVVSKLRTQVAINALVEFFGDTPLPAIGIPECRDYALARRKLGQADSTIRRELVVLRAAANHALRWKRITADRMPTFEMPDESDEGREVRWFSQAELDLLLSRVNETAESGSGDVKDRAERLRDFIILVYYWGARRNSVETLEVGQVELKGGFVNLRKQGEQRTKKRRPVVPIFPEQREVLERRVAADECGFLFGPSYNGYHTFRSLCEQCGMPEGRRHPHMLRHSRATHMLMAGDSIYKVAKLLGNTVEIVEKVYGHYSTEFLAQ